MPHEIASEEGVKYVYELGRLMGIGVGAGNAAWGTDGVGPIAAQYSAIQMYNPGPAAAVPGSGRTNVYIERVILRTTTAATVRFDRYGTRLTNGGAIASRAFRDENVNLQPVAELRNQTTAANVVSVRGRIQLLANTDYELKVEGFLLPENGFAFELETVNLALFATWWWREEERE
jgi:hypothetical protein